MLVQSQTAARVKVQIDAPKPVKHAVPSVPSEDIELPKINSEYSDSEDEDRVRTFNPPEWAQSPELRQALEMQSTMIPDDIFGAVRPLNQWILLQLIVSESTLQSLKITSNLLSTNITTFKP